MLKNFPGISIVIIGGGANGIATLIQLVDHLSVQNYRHCVKIYLVERNLPVGPGLAYSTKSDSNILNMPAETMSLLPNNQRHFHDWMTSGAEPYSVESSGLEYPPRKVFGQYIQAQLDIALAQASKNGLAISILHDEVIDISRSGCAFTLTLDANGVLNADYFVLALGNIKSSPFSSLAPIAGSRFLDSPFPDHRLQEIPEDCSVAILGTHLTAIDAITSLQANGHHGKIFAVSRSGSLPKVRGRIYGVYERQILTIEKINALIEQGGRFGLTTLATLLEAELKLALGDSDFSLRNFIHQSGDITTTLVDDISLAEQGEVVWHSVLNSLDSCIEELWSLLETLDKQAFLSSFYSVFCCYRFPTPIPNAKKILSLLKQEQLQIFGGLRSIKFSSGRFEIGITQGLSDFEITADYIIDATGTIATLLQGNHKLLSNLVRSGLIVSDPISGIRTDFETSQIADADENKLGQGFVLGNLTKGTYLYTNALGMNVRHAAHIALQIVEKISSVNAAFAPNSQ